MVIVWALSWWYGAGWKTFVISWRERLETSYDYFSINLLITNLFAPFRQISAGSVSGPIDVMIRAFFDRLVSRIIGAIVRIILIVVGLIWLLLQSIAGFLSIALWPFVPLAPVLGFVLAISGRTIL